MMFEIGVERSGFPLFYEMGKQIFHRKPYLTLLVASGAIVGFELVFVTKTVFAAPLLFNEPTSLDIVVKFGSLIALIFTGIGFIAAFVWYVVKGKSSEQQEKTIRQLETRNTDLSATVAEKKADLAEAKEEIAKLEKENENLRKANLRLQGIHDSQ